MTTDGSRFDLTPLRQAVAAWWETHLEALDPSEAEPLALTLSRALAQVMLQPALTRSTGLTTYQGSRLPCAHCGGSARFVGYRSRWRRTLCGDPRVARAYYHCAAGRHGPLPWDQHAGLNERIFSPAVKALGVECCAQLTHREVETLLARGLGLELVPSAMMKTRNAPRAGAGAGNRGE